MIAFTLYGSLAIRSSAVAMFVYTAWPYCTTICDVTVLDPIIQTRWMVASLDPGTGVSTPPTSYIVGSTVVTSAGRPVPAPCVMRRNWTGVCAAMLATCGSFGVVTRDEFTENIVPDDLLNDRFAPFGVMKLPKIENGPSECIRSYNWLKLCGKLTADVEALTITPPTWVVSPSGIDVRRCVSVGGTPICVTLPAEY